MGTATSLLLANIGEGAISMGGGLMQASAIRNQGNFERQQYNGNARLEELRGEDAILRGSQDAAAVGRQAEDLASAGTAAAAGGGADARAGSAAAVRNETDLLGQMDADQVRSNAWREAWGHGVSANDLRIRGRLARASSKTNAGATIATGGAGLGRSLIRGGMLYDEYSKYPRK